jgi:stage III sporulation protein AA
MITAKKRPFEEAVEFLPRFKDKLSAVSPSVREKTREIRLRAGQPIVLELPQDRHYINASITPDDLKHTLEIFCDYSLHSFARQIAQGFITLAGGHRAGFCGTAVLDANGERVSAIRGITSVNLRIARQFIGCSDEMYGALRIDDMKCLLIIGKPMSAKTTVLRDFARNLSRDYKVTVIDERGELAFAGADIGLNTDVLNGFPKRAGFITALRALSPEFILCDEIAGDGEQVAECMNSGVNVVMTAHCGSLEEALQSNALSGVIRHVNYIALLGTGKNIGRLEGLYRSNNENSFCNILRVNGGGVRLSSLGGA